MYKAYKLFGEIKDLGFKVFKNQRLSMTELTRAKRFLAARTQEIAKLLRNEIN